MTDFFEIDFLDVESKKSGDAIALRYVVNDSQAVHIVDGGFQDTGEKLVSHVRKYFGRTTTVDHVVVTHSDGDHAGGLRTVLTELRVGTLWMLRPWIYADQLLPRFSRFRSAENLRARLRDVYSSIAALEEIALERRVPIREPLQGQCIGAFSVLAPSKERFIDLIVASEKTPEIVSQPALSTAALVEAILRARAGVSAFVRSLWGQEVFSDEETSAENEMSVVQYARIAGERILLTGDAGRASLTEAASFAPSVGLTLPGIDRFQVPHHGSRRNVSTKVLDGWLGGRLTARPTQGTFRAIISSAKEDEHHPRKAVVRALIHRGADVVSTEGRTICCASRGAPARAGWAAVAPLPYPEEQEQ